MAKDKKTYYEPDGYIPKRLRKEFGLGEYNEEAQKEAKEAEERAKTNKEIRKFANGN